ncbi:hypothetical protein MKZ38_007374 [Zalerion maritima]|uniref:Kelch repeat-containing protein n=1 Tax=Zalerion maritima TaxID=339359 RepID=A0AAD5WP62_9PEZI|nr:hypothetical protein MKZ38_007374 [Zalerion maritima]
MASHTGTAASLWLSALVALGAFFQPSIQQHDPVTDFCRRFGHQTAVVDDRLYVDGGLVNYKPMSSDPGNYTNTWFAWHDLKTVHEGMPKINVDLNKNASIPSVHGGALWADDVNYRLFLFGGEFADTAPTTFNILSYDIWYDQWDNFGPPSGGIKRASYGASTNVAERGEGYYYGGYLSNASVPAWGDNRLATTGLIRYDMDSNSWTNITGPDGIGRAEGVMTFIPASDSGMLIYFGGIRDVNGTIEPQPMEEILIFDVVSTKWHIQNATGTIPEYRRKFCAGAVWPDDKSSYNIYLNSGEGFEGPGYDDVYILTIPTFTWIKTYPLNTNGTGLYPSHSLTCNVVNEAQMLTIGGSFPLDYTCDYEGNWGVHNIDLGNVIPDNFEKVWAGFDTDLEGYSVPEFVYDVVGGSKDGGATKTEPGNGWGNPDLGSLMSLKAEFETRTRKADGRTPPATATATTKPESDSKLSKGAIIGIAVGGGVALLAIIAGIWIFCRRKSKKKAAAPPVEMSSTPLTPRAPISPYHDPSMAGTNPQQYMHPGYQHSGSGGVAGGYSPGQHRPSNWSWSTSPANSPVPVPTSSTSPQPPRSEMDGNTYRPVELDGASPGFIMQDARGVWIDEQGRPVGQDGMYPGGHGPGYNQMSGK